MYPEIISADFSTDPEALILLSRKTVNISKDFSKLNNRVVKQDSVHNEMKRKESGKAEGGEGRKKEEFA